MAASLDERHEPTVMVSTGRYNRKQGGRTGGRKWNVWYHGYKCPACGRWTEYPCNLWRGRSLPTPVCDGRDRKGLRRPLRINLPF